MHPALCKKYQDAMAELESQRAKFQIAESWYRHIIEFSPDAMLVVNRRGIIMMANPKAHEVFSYAAGKLVGTCVDLLVPRICARCTLPCASASWTTGEPLP